MTRLYLTWFLKTLSIYKTTIYRKLLQFLPVPGGKKFTPKKMFWNGTQFDWQDIVRICVIVIRISYNSLFNLWKRHERTGDSSYLLTVLVFHVYDIICSIDSQRFLCTNFREKKKKHRLHTFNLLSTTVAWHGPIRSTLNISSRNISCF